MSLATLRRDRVFFMFSPKFLFTALGDFRAVRLPYFHWLCSDSGELLSPAVFRKQNSPVLANPNRRDELS
jgi:hypothetical protein